MTIEKVYQFLDSFQKLKDYLKTNKILLGSTLSSIEAILDSMESTSTYWAKSFRSHNLDLEQTTSSIAESMNGSLKRFTSKPLAHKSIANSAALMVAHSNKLLGKRQRLNEVNLAKTRCFEFASLQLNHVTTRCQRDIEDMIKDSAYYKKVRINKTCWYVWHEDTFKMNNDDDCIPKYSNVYCVEMNETFDECWCSEFCKTVSRKGIPCVHILTVVGHFHPKMVHPRWLKVYNSSLYDKCSNIFDDMLKWRIDNKSKVCIQDVLPDELKIYDETNTTDRNVDDIKRFLIAVMRMDHQKKVLLRGESIPDEFLNDRNENDTYIYSIDPTALRNNEVQRPEPEDESITHATMNDSYNMRWSYLNSFIKDLDKLVSGDPKSWPSVVNDLDGVIAKQVDRRRACEKTIHTPRQLVSSQLSIETSPNRRRYKSFSERFKR
jgi:hypothetical protein